MHAFRSGDLQKHLGDVLNNAEVAPCVLLNRGQPRAVIMSAAEYRRLKVAAGEPIPSAALPRRPLVLRGRNDDPLGYDTSDLAAAARQMAEDYLSGKTAGAVAAERGRVLARLGLKPKLERVPDGPGR